MNFSSSDETKITNAFTKLIQNELKKKELVDTGKLVKSISTKIKYTNSGISFEVSGEDYFKYLDDEYNVTEDALKSSGFDKIIELIEEAFVKVIEKEI